MPDALQKTLSSLRALAEDHRSGAAEIADRAAALLESFCSQARPRDPRLPYALAELAELTLKVQPSMAPLLNLANLVQLAAEAPAGRSGTRRLARQLRHWRAERQVAAAKIARLFLERIKRRAGLHTYVTFSYSSTVLAALLDARKRLREVVVSEARPMLEGRTMAERLAAAGVEVTLVADSALPGYLAQATAVVVGADAVLADGYVNKIGTSILQAQARADNRQFFLLADTSKFLPAALATFHHVEDKPAHELWRGAPPPVNVVNRYFETIPLVGHITLLCEHGALAPAQVARLLRSRPIAQRWSELGGREPKAARAKRKARK